MPNSQLLSVDLEMLDLLTAAEVARVLRVSKVAVYRSPRVGRSFRVRSEAVRSYLGIETPLREVG